MNEITDISQINAIHNALLKHDNIPRSVSCYYHDINNKRYSINLTVPDNIKELSFDLCNICEVKKLDVSNLEILSLNSNYIKSLKLDLKNVKEFRCSYGPLQNLEIINAPMLQSITVCDTYLHDIDISNLPNLNEIICYHAPYGLHVNLEKKEQVIKNNIEIDWYH